MNDQEVLAWASACSGDLGTPHVRTSARVRPSGSAGARVGLGSSARLPLGPEVFVKPAPFRYVAPRTVADAVAALAEAGPGGKVLAGGQSLVPLLNMRLVAPSVLVDVNGVDGLGGVEVDDHAVVVGATVRQRTLERHGDAVAAVPLLARALSLVAHPVIRNRGTVVGSLVHADPAAELPAVLALLDGHVTVEGPDGRRDVAAADGYLGPMTFDLAPDEVAVSATFPVPAPTTGTAFHELARRHGDYAMAGVCVAVDRDASAATVTGARAVFVGVGERPEAVDLGVHLAGSDVDDLDTDAAVAAAREAIEPTDDIHATADYRRHLAGILLARALVEAAAAPAGPAMPVADDGRVA